MLVSWLVFFYAIVEVGSLPVTFRRKRLELMIMSQFGNTLSPEEFDQIIQMFAKDGATLSRSDFILGILQAMDKISAGDIKSIGDHFDELDADGNGYLSPEDVKRAFRAPGFEDGGAKDVKPGGGKGDSAKAVAGLSAVGGGGGGGGGGSSKSKAAADVDQFSDESGSDDFSDVDSDEDSGKGRA
jgi:hypothetical protein